MYAMPAWAHWNAGAAERPWTVGIEEEVVLVSPDTWLPVSRCEDVLAAMPGHIADSTRAETHGSAIELATVPHSTIGGAIAELGTLRAEVARVVDELGVRVAATGTHPTARWEDVEVSPGARYQFLHASMRELARREPTFGLHVHVAIPEPETAVRALNAIRGHLPLLLALSGNSPFWQGRDSGLASARTPVFQAFPRTGPPRWFDDYADYVEAIDVLVRCDAIPEPTFLWWDARLQPRFGTLEVRVMDAQTRIEDTAAIATLVQCLVRLEASREGRPAEPADEPEVLSENRFIAARDGMAAALIDPPSWGRRPLRDRLAALLDECAPHARALDCVQELAQVPLLSGTPGAERQRDLAARRDSLEALVEALSDDFVGAIARPSLT
jgi:glutamate---cysteine ligase / carboxylate-amine ligase